MTHEETLTLHDRVLMWLGTYRDHLPAEAVQSLQSILREARGPDEYPELSRLTLGAAPPE